MTIIWGYSPDSKLPRSKKIGHAIPEVKQVFSALLFKEGINGIIIRIESIQEQTEAIMKLIIDDEVVISENLVSTVPGDFTFKTEDTLLPKTKIEVAVEIIKGCIQLPISAIGNGMGFQKKDGSYLPTNHLGLGLIL
ncbi:MAG: hypothetical protein HGN29_07495 [Asgard group archaeon]|nr:hypothetical protein [Asgard group archaeon]